jgi:hypothetical protein
MLGESRPESSFWPFSNAYVEDSISGTELGICSDECEYLVCLGTYVDEEDDAEDNVEDAVDGSDDESANDEDNCNDASWTLSLLLYLSEGAERGRPDDGLGLFESTSNRPTVVCDDQNNNKHKTFFFK